MSPIKGMAHWDMADMFFFALATENTDFVHLNKKIAH